MRSLPYLSFCLAISLAATNADAQYTARAKTAPTKDVPPMGPPTSGLLAVGGSDDCANAAAANAIAGAGVFAVTTVGATNGSPDAASCVNTQRDVWFYWTATSTGVATINTCGGTTVDTVLTVWADGAPAGSCPSGAAVACNDDFCGLQSQVAFSALAGTSYFLQFGAFSAATTYSGTFSIAVAGPPANDECGTPIAIGGTGSYPFSTASATTGTQGQTEPLCLAFGQSAIDNDVWFAWTAPNTGAATVSFCGGTATDTKVAAYAGSGCPAGPALACNDDTCGLQSELAFACVAGQVYSLQVGNYPGAAGGAGTFTIGIVDPDSCATPTPISGAGTFPFDNTAATTGTEGQSEAGCLYFGTSGITNDVWYRWTATTSGAAMLSLCGQSTMDSKVAVYGGSGCPAAAAIACNDDSCGFQSQLSFSAVAGQDYLIQLGNYPGATGSTGTFTIDVVAPPTGCQYDDGTAENSIGLSAGGQIVALQRFSGGGGSTDVASISAAFGAPAFPDPALNGLPFTVAVWDDPNDDGLPNDLVLLATASSVIANEATNTFITATLGAPVSVSGVFFVGVAVAHGPGRFPLALDQSQASGGRAFVAGEVGGTVDLANLSAAGLPPTDMDGIGLPGVWLLRADCSGGVPTGTVVCEGTPANCPCGNAGAVGNGCANSVNPAGAHLTATGNPSIGSDSVRLNASGMTTGPQPSYCTFVQASSLTSGATFGDGVSCLGASMIRLGTRLMSGGSASFGAGIAGDPPVSVAGMVGAPGTRHYQVVYRNSAVFCTSATFNVTNGYSIVWN
ncbi:MAG: hypothetical protein NTY35_15790 [Planctomycetota bacterium]|nr:hypothetical protein [Planctomycetota bacterium]